MTADGNDSGPEPKSVVDKIDFTDVAAARAARLWAAAAAAAKICISIKIFITLRHRQNNSFQT